MRKENMFIVDYACGFHPFVCEVDYTCALRCQAALRAFKKYPHARIVLGAGMGNVTGGCGPLSDMMQTFLLERGVPMSAILSNPLGYNTLTETEAAHEIIQKNGGGEVICATSRYHAARVWCIWFFRFGIMTRMYTSKLRVDMKSLVIENCKIPLDCIRAFAYRFYNRR